MSAMVGGISDSTLTSESREYLIFALSEYNKREGKNYNFSTDKLEDSIINVQHQVVSGSKYIFTVKLKGEKENIHQLSVWSQPWINHLELVEAREL